MVTNKESRRVKDRVRDKLPYRVAKAKAWLNSSEGKAWKKQRDKNDRENNKDKYAAYEMIKYRVRQGIITPQSCDVCGNTRSEAHHGDYSKPLEVVWPCKAHHKERHWAS